jgi:hypothetical protein
MRTRADEMLSRLSTCPVGANGWREFEDVCIELLTYLFVPPLQPPRIQARTHSGIDRRDAVFANRNFDAQSSWGLLLRELGARMILFEFKNYDHTEIGKEEVDQTRNYLTATMGRLAVLCCSKEPCEAARIRRNSIYSSDEKKVILFLTPDHLREMCFIRERGEDPADLIVDLVEEFYLQHE